MSGEDRVLLLIGSGLKLYREYIIESAARRATELGLKLVLVNNLKPTWQQEYFDEITVVNVFDHEQLRDAARRSPVAERWSGWPATTSRW
ncbi:hypothetical protein ACFQ0T_02685 [Kitasatospora gansuensis]